MPGCMQCSATTDDACYCWAQISLALERGGSDEGVDESMFKAFDANADGVVDLAEWKATLGDFGPNGSQVGRASLHYDSELGMCQC